METVTVVATVHRTEVLEAEVEFETTASLAAADAIARGRAGDIDFRSEGRHVSTEYDVVHIRLASEKKQLVPVFSQRVLIEFRNSSPAVEVFYSKTPITTEKILRYYQEQHDFNEDRDSFTLLDDPDEIDLDEISLAAEDSEDECAR